MLELAVGSILGQSLEAFEFLILDDGSTLEETRGALAAAARGDSRICLLREPHRGLTATLNRGLDLARGALIARQDADDWSEPLRLARQTAFLKRNPETVLVGTAAAMHQQDGGALWRAAKPETHAQIVAALRRGNPFIHGSVMFRREAARKVGGYRAELPCSQDYDFFWRLAEAGETANLAEALYHYRYTAGSVSASRAVEQARAERAAQELARARRRGVAEDVEQALAQSHGDGKGAFRATLRQADHLLLAGEYSRAARAYWSAARGRPASALGWAKLARWALFRGVPGSRRLCFR